MAITIPAYQPTTGILVTTASSGNETAAGVQMQHTSTANNFINAGALVGASLKHTTNAGATEKVIVRFYRAADKTDLIVETEVSFNGANDLAYIQPDLPIPFFSGLWATTSSAAGDGGTGAVESVNIKPDVMAIAGNG
tara:strand:- start:4656 stop:5069 length:414 start_codon:yes stop_codon:yes gene_type:complete